MQPKQPSELEATKDALDYWYIRATDLEVEVADLKLELAAATGRAGWVPVEDGDLHSFLALQDNGETIAVFVNDDYGYAEEALPDNVRLFRRRPPAAATKDDQGAG